MKKLLTKILCACISIFALNAVSALAEEYSGQTFDLTYEMLNGEITITDCYYRSTIVEIPESINGYPVTRIGKDAFSKCDSLTSITIPNGVTSIGKYAFYRCRNLTNITIPNSVTSIENYAFYDCDRLTNMTIPNGVDSIGNNAFSYCSRLTSITIPNSVKSVGNEAFSYCSSLTNITIPKGVTSIGCGVFYKCSSLTSITLSSGVTSVLMGAFSHCSSLTSITIPNSVRIIGNETFSYCGSLTSITIPNSVKSIGDSAFSYCSNLKDVYYDGNEEEWGKIVGKNKYDLVNVTIHYNSEMSETNGDNSEVPDNDTDIHKVIFTIGEKNSRVFGKLQENDVAPIIRSNRTMLPARAVAESLGGTVGWDENNKAVTVNGKNKNGEDVSLVINIGSDTAYVNGEAVTLDSPAFIENNRTYTPVRFIAENLGADVSWDEENQRVILEKNQ